MDYRSIDNSGIEQSPIYQHEKLDPSFPFRTIDSAWKSFFYHWHEVLEIVYVMRGHISAFVEGKVFEAAKGDIIVINSCDVHGFFGAEFDDSIMIVQIGLEVFEETLVDLRGQFFHKLVFDRKIFIRPNIDGDLHHRLESLLLAMRKEYTEKKSGYRIALRAKIYEFALVFLREIPERSLSGKEVVRYKSHHEILERVFSYIYSNADNPDITLEDAANAAAMSKFYFTRFFKEQTGQTFHDFLSRLRISAAREYLLESEMSITEIAYHCGFASLKTFNRLFKTYVNVSPSEYRIGRKDYHNRGRIREWNPIGITSY
jgi:AraC-like DNA-binding protein/mannose-6-phosphate isomerase-like protein (cupin superfamily)